MGLLARLKSLDGFSQRPLQERNGNIGNAEKIQPNKSIHNTTATQSPNEGVKIVGRSSRRGSETARSISSSSTGIPSNQNQQSPRLRSIIPKEQTDQTVNHHARKRSLTNPNTPTQNLLPRSSRSESGLPTPFKRDQSSAYEDYKQSLSYANTSQTSLHLYKNQSKRSSGSMSSVNANGNTIGTPLSMIEGEVVESNTFPTSASLVTSSLRSSEQDSSRLFSGSWHSPNPGAKFNNSPTIEYDDEGLAEEIVDETQSSNDTFYAKTTWDQNADSSSYSTDIDSNSQLNSSKASLGTHTLRKASSRFKSGFMRSTKRPSTADASMIHRQASPWDSMRRRESHNISQSSSVYENVGQGLRLGVPRKSVDSFTSTISVGSKNTMTRSTTIVPSQTAADSKLPLPGQENIKDEQPFTVSAWQRTRTSSFTSSHSVKAAIRSTLSPPTSRGGSQNNHESPSPLISPKSQNFEFAAQNNGQPHSPALNTPSLPSQQYKASQSRPKLLHDQSGSFKSDHERIISRDPAFEIGSLTPAPRKRSKSRTSKGSNDLEKSMETAEPVPEIPSQYRDERRSSIATTSFYSEDHTLSSEECDSIDHKSSINEDLPGLRSSISTSTTSAQQHTPQSSISGSSSMAQLYPNEKQIGGERIHESLMPRSSSLTQQENSERPSRTLTSWKTQTIDAKFELLTPESFSSTSRSRLREIQNLSASALRLHNV